MVPEKNNDGIGEADPAGAAGGGRDARWTFLSIHGQVLLGLASAPSPSMREVAARLGITERAVQRAVRDLEAAGYLTRLRAGRRNRYTFHADRRLRHPLVAHREVRALLDLVGPGIGGLEAGGDAG